MRLLGLFLSFVILTGCGTTPINQLSYAEQIKLSNKFEANCQKLGLNPNSQEYKQCYYQEAVAEQSRRIRQKQFAQNMQNASMEMQKIDAQRAAANRRISCTSTGLPGMITTNCM